MKAKEALRVPGSITYKGWILTDAACSVMKRTIILEVLPKKKEKKKQIKFSRPLRHTGSAHSLVLHDQSDFQAFYSGIHMCLKITLVSIPVPQY